MVEEDFRALTDALKGNNKVSFFAILKMDELTDKWSLLFSGPRLLDTEKKKKLFEEIVPLIRTDGRFERRDVARVGIFPLTNHLVKVLREHQTGANLRNERANGNFIHEGYILINKGS
jgi:hypothetical protein